MTDIRDGISVVTACKGRNANLATCLPSWLACPEVTEVVILDWTSSPRVEESVDVSDPRVRIVRVNGEEKWLSSMAWNAAMRQARCTRVAKFDCDDLVTPDFFKVHVLAPGTFFAGNWSLASDKNNRSLNGMAFLYRQDYIAANGYNERICTYGWEDDDFFQRLMSLGLKRRNMDFSRVKHVPHSDDDRMRDVPVPDLFREILRNKDMSFLFPWKPTEPMTEFAYREVAPRRMEGTRVPATRWHRFSNAFKWHLGRSPLARFVRVCIVVASRGRLWLQARGLWTKDAL